jgi:hypothetical protein
MGLLLKDESPDRVAENGWPARTPLRSLIVVPELPQSITFFGSLYINAHLPECVKGSQRVLCLKKVPDNTLTHCKG